MDNFFDNVLQTIAKYDLISSDDRIVVGLSGGADSCVLLHCLANLFGSKGTYIVAAHLNHGIRGAEAERDQTFAREFSQNCLVEFVTRNVDVPEYAKKNKISEEMAGRILRYEFFEDVCKKYCCNKIAVAHNKNDCAETILLNLIRGTGSGGFEGIKPKNGKIIRPLIGTTRIDIENYAKDNSIFFLTDSTNLSDIYSRNKIRNIILPEMAKINPGVIDNILRSSEIIQAENSFVDCYINGCEFIEYKDNGVYIDRENFSRMQTAIRRRIILKAVKYLCGNTLNVSSKQISAFDSELRTGSIYKIGNQVHCVVASSCIIVTITQSLFDDVQYFYKISVPGKIEIKEINCEYKFEYVTKYQSKPDCLYISADNIDESKLYIRSRKDGDTFVPYGMSGTKKIKKFFIDNKIPSHQRIQFPLLIHDQDVCCILPLRINDRYKITKDTKKILMISKI